MNFNDKRLYACGEEGGDVAGLVRLDPPSPTSARAITWVNPGGRQRAYEVARVLADDADHFVFVDERGRKFELRELTPAFYNERIKRPQDPPLAGAAELLAAFEASLA